MFKKLLISVSLSVYLILNTTAPAAQAQGVWYDQSYKEWLGKVHSGNNTTEIFGERYTRAQVQWIFYSLVDLITGGSGSFTGCVATATIGQPNDYSQIIFECINPLAAFFNAILNLVDRLSYNSSGTPSALAVTTFSRPISSLAYFEDVAHRLKLIPEASAQGFGFTAVSPMLTLWRTVRNITYFLLILVIIAMAFMIMFRVKLSPQTVISIQSALPKIIISLILITFSYAIAGFVIDLMYVVIGLVAAILSASGMTTFDWAQMYNALTNEWALKYLFIYFLLFIPFFIIYMIVGGILGAATGTIGIVTVIGLLILAAVALTLLAIILRVFWILLKNFVIVLLLVVAGPIIILLGTINVGGGFSSWIKNLAAHLAIYPTVGILMFLCFMFLRGALVEFENIAPPITPPVSNCTYSTIGQLLDCLMPMGVTQQFTPGITAWSPPLTVGSQALGLIWFGVSLIILTIIPKASNLIRDTIQGRPFAAGTAFGQAMGTGVALPQRAYDRVIGERREAKQKVRLDKLYTEYSRGMTGKAGRQLRNP
jgi:hypothetical protein